MSEQTVAIPYKIVGDKCMLMLFVLGDTDNVRAATINKPRQIQDEDKHHCAEANVKGSIRYMPKKWVIY